MIGQETGRRKIMPSNHIHGPFKVECALNVTYLCERLTVCIQEGQFYITQTHFQCKMFYFNEMLLLIIGLIELEVK